MGEGSSSPKKRLCAEAPQLIQKVLTGQEPERSDAWLELVNKCILPILRLVMEKLGMSKRILQDFLDKYQSHIFEHLKDYDPSKGAFSTWCYQVLSNLGRDLVRAESSRRKHEILTTDLYDPERAERRGVEELAVDTLPEPVWESAAENRWLPPRKITILEKLPILRRVIVCAATGLVWRIPPPTWRQWVELAGLGADFPPQELADYDVPFDRLRFLSEYLGISYSSLRQHWYRSLEVLKDLFREEKEP